MPQKKTLRRALVPLMTLWLLACQSYEPEPVEPLALLEEMNASPVEDTSAASLSFAEALAWAFEHHPGLAVAEASVEVARSELIEAGLPADPTLSFSAADLIAASTAGGGAANVDIVSGLGLQVPLPRPGELSAREAAARAIVDEARAGYRRELQSLAVSLARALAEEQALERRGRWLSRRLRLARSLAQRMNEGRDAGAVTAMQAGLARFVSAELDSELRMLNRDLEATHRKIATILGAAPETRITIQRPTRPIAPDLLDDPETLIRIAVEKRADLQILLARYARREAELELAVRRQFPSIQVGTGLSIQLPIFSGFNSAAIATAGQRRLQAREALRLALHELRAEIHDRQRAWHHARERARIEEGRRAGRDEIARLLEQGLEFGSTSILEALSAEQQLIEAEGRGLDAERALELAELDLWQIIGLLPAPAANNEEEDEGGVQ